MSNFGRRSTADDVLADQDLEGKTIMLTGCASGIGFESMRALAAKGATVIGAARTLEKAEKACNSIKGKCIPIACEHSDFESISQAITAVRKLDTDIDAIIANAGIMTPKTPNTRYGVESQFLVNHLSHMYLILGLEDKLKDRTGRVVIVSSDAHNMAPKNIGIDFDNISGEHNYTAFRFYGQSKLANIAFAKSMSERLADRGITANSLHPGVITGTSLFRTTPKVFAWAFSLFSKTIGQGAATQCYLAAHPDLVAKTGGYYSDCKLAKVKAPGEDPEFQRKLWEFSMEIIEKHAPNLDSIS